ncbi:helix-turn-helix domain-containing protein [Kitasatospora sp. A2-31]|uniref:helix-turn-helix domain-containing protein n=1 Tax=Kitasatospora sp. A2-31 TaxID=2916414 RepID=UPI001EEF6678|nr:helix-turn-helix transcriptional regulator [Kitasatospora sp. A2-31]MCG6499419.1 helix-turn-helix transcriptional regulator [Kitasatospora sp. A2-31]
MLRFIPHHALPLPMIAHTVAHVRAHGPNIRSKRERQGYGLRRFAALVDVSPAHLSRIERGQRGAQPEVIQRIARGLGVEITDIADLSA